MYFSAHHYILWFSCNLGTSNHNSPGYFFQHLAGYKFGFDGKSGTSLLEVPLWYSAVSGVFDTFPDLLYDAGLFQPGQGMLAVGVDIKVDIAVICQYDIHGKAALVHSLGQILVHHQHGLVMEVGILSHCACLAVGNDTFQQLPDGFLRPEALVKGMTVHVKVFHRARLGQKVAGILDEL